MSINDYIRNGRLMTSALSCVSDNVPHQYKDRQKGYYGDETSRYLAKYGKYATDYVEAEVQGLDTTDPYGYTKVHLRFAEIVKPSASIAANFDNYKQICIVEEGYNYIRRGAKIKCMGSTWIVINPANISGGDGNSIIQRCDAVWHYLDYYGNVCSEPMCVDEIMTKANDNDAQRSVMVTKGYFNATMQYNEATKQLGNNARLVLGRNAYRITGFSDFIQEFTDDYGSVGLIGFTIRFEPFNDAIDDMENHVAGGKTFEWNIHVDGSPIIKAGEEMQLDVYSTRVSGEHSYTINGSTDLHPVDYTFESDNEDVATVDCLGVVEGVSNGEANILVSLAQNPAKQCLYAVKVQGSTEEPHVEFENTVPNTIRAYKSAVITAAYYEGGTATEEIVDWILGGANDEAYSYTVNGNEITVKCWAGSITPLEVTASYGAYSETAEIILEGI